jgi:segregation and condensation protein B
LFSSGKKMSVDEIAKLTRIPAEVVRQSLGSLKSDYESKESSLLLMDEGDGWKLAVREQYASVVRKIVAETELTKSVIETLAVIAWKAPVLQSDIIKVRTNKAYDHLNELESTGFISRAKHGRTKLIRLTDRFFRYFDLKNADDIKTKFKIKEPEKQQALPEMSTGKDAAGVSESPVEEAVSDANGQQSEADGKDVPS